MKTLLQQYTAQASNDSDFRTLDSIEDKADVQLDALDSLSTKYKSIQAQLMETGTYRQSIALYINDVVQLADASKEASPSDWNNPEQIAIGYAMDNSSAGDNVESELEFIATLDMYIECGVECEKELDEGSKLHAVNLPIFNRI